MSEPIASVPENHGVARLLIQLEYEDGTYLAIVEDNPWRPKFEFTFKQGEEEHLLFGEVPAILTKPDTIDEFVLRFKISRDPEKRTEIYRSKRMKVIDE